MDNKETNVFQDKFIPNIIKWGIITLILGLIVPFGPVIYLWSIGLIPSGKQILHGLGLSLATFGVIYFVEPFSYFPVLGIPGTYMAFLSGNISNLRLPCSAVAQEAAEVEEGSDEGSIISTIAIAVSMIVNTGVLFLGAIGLAALLSSLPPRVLLAFDYILPAIFGAIFGQFLIRNYLIGIIAFAIGIFLNYTRIIPMWGSLLVLVFGTIIISRILFDKNIIK